MSAQPASLETRVQALEDKLADLTRENGELKKKLGLDARAPGAFVTAAGKEAKLAITGYIQGQAEFGDAADTRFVSGDRIALRRARLGVKGSFAEHFDFTLISEFGANTVGSSSAIRAQAVDAFVVWKKYEAASVTLGQFKTPYGYEQLVSDPKTLTIERSLPNDRLTLSRQIGAMVSGVAPGKRVTYAAGVFNGNGVNTSANDNDQFLYVGRVSGVVAQTTSMRLALGAAAFTSRDTGAFTGRRTGRELDAQFAFGPAEINAEYFRINYDRDAGVDYGSDGWALLGACFVVPKTLQAVVRYETCDLNRSVANDDADLWTIGCNYLIKGDDLKLSANYLLGDPAGALSDQGRFITRLQVVF